MENPLASGDVQVLERRGGVLQTAYTRWGNEKKKGRMMTAEERQSLYFMKSALIGHYKRKYTEDEALITEICEMVGRLLDAQEPQGAGGVGMIRGWEESILEIEANH